jgi:ABC-type polysaccharide/polyol phosphate export permease
MDTATHMLRTGQRGARFQLHMALKDLGASVERIGLAWSLASHDIVARYRGSILGPFWITLSMGVMVAGIGLLNASLLKEPVHDFIPFVACGIVFFGLVSGTINEGCEMFVQASGILSQTSLPMFTFVWRVMLRNLICLGHNLVIIAGVLIWFGYWRTMNPSIALLGLALVVVNSGWAAMLAGIASARFRDVPQIIVALLQFAIFFTPIFWTPSHLGSIRFVLEYNPFYYLVEAVRAPLMGQPAARHTYLIITLMAAAGWGVCFAIFTRTRRRIVHYL